MHLSITASRIVAIAMLASVTSVPAFADGTIVGLMSDQERTLLGQFDTRRQAAITAAEAAPDEAARKILAQVLAGEAVNFDEGHDPSGDWRCRYLKLGKEAGLTIYGWFDCRVFDDGAGWVLRKTSGSQRSSGRLYQLDARRLLYLGALHYAYEAPLRFGDKPARNQMAVLTRLSDGRMRLEFPAPLAESDFDILELLPRQ